jgi:hypothetical protein
VIVHVPVVTNVTVPPLVTVHTLVVLLVYVTGSVELAVALRLNGGSKMLLSLNTVKVIVCSLREVNDRVTVVAGAYFVPLFSPPAWAAVMVQVPNDTIVTVPSLVTVHTPVVLLVYVTAKPESLVPVRVNAAASWSTGLGAANVIVWGVRTVNDWLTVGATA